MGRCSGRTLPKLQLGLGQKPGFFYPNDRSLREAALRALKAIGAAIPEGLGIHPADDL